MAEVDALLDDEDVDDFDLGKDEEAKLLYGDDDEDEGDLLEDEQEDSHRDKFASERAQQHIEQIEQKHENSKSSRDNHYPRYNRGRGAGRGSARGRGRLGPKPTYNKLCYVNPSFLQQGMKKPVQSVQPWLNQPRQYGGPERIVTNAPFNGTHLYNQQQQQQQMPMNNQQYGPPQQQSWQPPPPQQQQQQQQFAPPSQNYCNRPMQSMQQPQQQCYPPQIPQNPQYNPHMQSYPNQQPGPAPPPQFNYEHPQKPGYHGNGPQNYNSNMNANYNQFSQPPQQYQSQQHNVPPGSMQHYNQPHPPSMPPQQHASYHMQHPQQMTPNNHNYYDAPQQSQNYNMNQNHSQNYQNQSLGPPQPQPYQNNPPPPPQRHSGPLLQRPPLLVHESGQQPNNQHFSPAPRQRFSPPSHFHNQNHHFRPNMRPSFNNHNREFGGGRGHYRGGQSGNFNNRPPFKRRNDHWQEGNGIDEGYNKRRSWNNYNEDEYYEEEYPEQQQEEYSEQQQEESEQTGKDDEPHEGNKESITFKVDTTADDDEDEETKAYRKKIEEQKRLREEILAEKERKRKLAIMKRTGEVSDIPALESSPPKEQRKVVLRTVGSNPNLRVLTRSDGEDSRRAEGGTDASTGVPKVRIKAGVAPTKNATGDAPKLTSGFLATRKVIAKDDSLPDTPVVIVHNLAATTTEPKLRKLCHGVGLVQSLDMSSKERQASIQFQSVASAHAFYKKYQRYMLDLSMIQVELIPQNAAAN